MSIKIPQIILLIYRFCTLKVAFIKIENWGETIGPESNAVSLTVTEGLWPQNW